MILSISCEEDKFVERIGVEGVFGIDNKGCKGRKEIGNDKEK